MASAVRIGRKTQRITFERRSEAANELYGDTFDEVWSTYISAWASVAPVKGREFTGQDRTQSQITHRFYVRYTGQTALLGTNDRIVWRNNVYDIQSIIDIDGRRREIEIMAIGRDIPLSTANLIESVEFGAGFGDGFG
jgi:SPP1 family predicted phage head-tail adaptor